MPTLTTRSIVKEITKLHREIENLFIKSIDRGIRIGELLQLQKDRLGHGKFITWTNNNLPFKIRTAQRYLQLYDNQKELNTSGMTYLNEGYKLLGSQTENSPLSTVRNNFFDNPKNNVVYTPKSVSNFLHKIIYKVLKPKIILDIGIGKGSLTKPFNKSHIIGVDINPKSKRHCNTFINSKFEDIEKWTYKKPNLIMSNPPFNKEESRDLYPEVILRKIIELFGKRIPVVLFSPMGMRLNQRMTSKRWIWLRDKGPEITSIISLPIDIFNDVEFHNEILIFNLPRLKPHYWLNIK